jgi:hypothetical protein
MIPFVAPNEVGQRFAQSIGGIVPQILTTSIASAAAVSATTEMEGLGVYFTPLYSTRVKVFVTLTVAVINGTVWQLVPSYGTGTAPTASAALAGTQVGYGAKATSLTAAPMAASTITVIGGLTQGVQYWFDLEAIFSVSTMPALSNITVIIEEV